MTQTQAESRPSQAVAAPRPKVAVVYTRPETVLADIDRALKLADFEAHMPKEQATLLKINISWQHFYPACSTTAWQLDGAIQSLRAMGYDEEADRMAGRGLIAAQNGTVVVDS